MRPNVVVDITSRRANPYRRGSMRVRLKHRTCSPRTAARIARAASGIFAVLYFAFGSVAAPVVASPGLARAETVSGEERETLERELVKLEDEISKFEGLKAAAVKEGNTLKSEIKQLDANINAATRKIKAINLSLVRLDEEIIVKEGEITVTEGKITRNKTALSDALQIAYEQSQTNLFEILLENPTLVAFVDDLNKLAEVQDGLALAIGRITDLKNTLVSEKEVLAVKRSDTETLRVYQAAQKAVVEGTKQEKNTLLKVTKGRESEYQKLVQKTRETAARIRNRLFELVGGGELTFEQAYQFAKFAETVTGVRAALILAVADRESALGGNVGRCDYETSMHPTRDLPKFLALLAELKAAGTAPPEPVKVSCRNKDGLYGGAMGPLQVIPSTWDLYKERIAEVSGVRPPSPWNNAAAFAAASLFLSDAGAGKGVSLAKEREAAARYYAGKNWRRHLWGYGDWVVRRAEQFQKDINILNS